MEFESFCEDLVLRGICEDEGDSRCQAWHEEVSDAVKNGLCTFACYLDQADQRDDRPGLSHADALRKAQEIFEKSGGIESGGGWPIDDCVASEAIAAEDGSEKIGCTHPPVAYATPAFGGGVGDTGRTGFAPCAEDEQGGYGGW